MQIEARCTIEGETIKVRKWFGNFLVFNKSCFLTVFKYNTIQHYLFHY